MLKLYTNITETPHLRELKQTAFYIGRMRLSSAWLKTVYIDVNLSIVALIIFANIEIEMYTEIVFVCVSYECELCDIYETSNEI